ncbi:dTTP/UTP pyrophosphatase [Gammaproteobacteria bacterium]|nr:septum formation inhibitor Maf [Gammaproteobacteria bacterium]QOJ30685.1 MAG: septum formation inhibitor Maf [Gammaproteobacteria bacterium]CAG0940981.1 dTTP/UTP pyrophosphatase [Gammaproteobacteria bacterium]
MTHTGEPAVYLASASPRRRQLLAQIGIDCVAMAADLDESLHPGECVEAYVGRLAAAKARRVWEQVRAVAPRPVVAADTVVVAGAEVLGKPADQADCRRMLARLSGTVHEVLTAVTVVSAAGESSALSRSQVAFRPLAPAEIDAYWRSGEPADKAGGYAIQGRAAIFIEELRGSYSGVMGLPLFETARLLAGHGVQVLA